MEICKVKPVKPHVNSLAVPRLSIYLERLATPRLSAAMSRKRLRSDDEWDANPAKKRSRGVIWKVPPDLDVQTDSCAALLNALKKCKGSDSKQPLGDFLMRVPSKRVCPNYYDIVMQPIDLMKIQHKVVTDEYETISAFLADVQLLLSNTRLFYGQSSDEYKQADVLEADFTQVLNEYGIGATSSRSSPSTPSSSSSVSSFSNLPSPMSLTLRIPKAHFQFTPPVTGKRTRRSSSSSEPGRRGSQSSTTLLESKGLTKPTVSTSGGKGLSTKPISEGKGLTKSTVSASSGKGLSTLAVSEGKGLTRTTVSVSSGKGLTTKSGAESKGLTKSAVSSVKGLTTKTGTESKGATKFAVAVESKGVTKSAVSASGGRGATTKGVGTTSGGRSKASRQQPWIQEYLTSEDPIKIYLAAVCSYMEPGSGEHVAEPFLQLPSRTLYPEYYRVITQPMDLSTMHKNVESGKYPNLKAIQDDMIVMIKNAHHFNEPGSEIYKLASTLRKFIINRCSELERKYQTVAKTMPPDPPTTGGKIPKLKINITDAVRGQRTSTSDGDMDYHSSDDDWSSEEERDGEHTPGKLLLRIKKDKLGSASSSTAVAQVTPTDDHLAKLLLAKKHPSLKKKLMAIYRRIIGKTDESGRVLSELFVRRPSSKLYPEYYVVIKEPIDLREILGRIRSGGFPNLQGMMDAVDLMVENALTFNEEGSQIYQDALVLQEVARIALAQLEQAWPATPVSHGFSLDTPLTPIFPSPTLPPQRGRPRKIVPGAAVATPYAAPDVMALFQAVKHHTDSRGRHIWHTFKQLPTGVSVSDYYSVVKRPIDMGIMENKLISGLYTKLDQVFDDFTLMMDNAFTFFPRESRQAQDAIALQRLVVRKYLDLKSAENRAGKFLVPDIKERVQNLLQSILSQAVGSEGSVDELRGVVATREVELRAEGVVKHSFNLYNVEKWVAAGDYRRLDLLQGDVVAILKRASKQGKHDLAVEVGLRFLEARDKVCGESRNQLWSPALAYSVQELVSDLEAAFNSHSRTPSPSPAPAVVESPESVRSRSYSASPDPVLSSTTRTSTAEGEMEWEGPEERFEESDTCEYEGVKFSIGETIYVKPKATTPSDPLDQKKPHIVMIEKFWKDVSGTMCFDGVWFYRPEETFHLATKKFYEQEVFKSDFHGVGRMTQVVGKCGVMFYRDYAKLITPGFPDEDIYVCESRYSYRTKSFKKIKNWAVLGTPPTLVPRATPLTTINRVPSIFLAQAIKDERKTTPTKREGSSEKSKPEIGPLNVSYMGQSLKNIVVTATTNQDSGNIYYEQYCIDEDYFRLGDYVYLRSDQENPFMARIDRIWTDKNGDPWIHGPWFLRPKEVQHTPTRIFYRQELLLSNIQDSNPMRSISGKCLVLPVLDYCKKRPTGFVEKDVYVFQSRYNEADKEIKRIKGLRHPQLSPAAVADEVFHFAQDIPPAKVASPQLFMKEFNPVEAPLQPGLASSLPTPSGGSSLSLGGKLSGSPGGVTIPVAGKPGGINVTPQLLQQLLASASKLATTRPVVIPLPTSLSSTTTPTTHSLVSPSMNSSGAKPSPLAAPSSAQSSTPSGSTPQQLYPCLWTGCSQVYKGPVDLYTHVVGPSNVSHLSKEVEGSYFCRWRNCPRNPGSGGRPFDSLNKISRHMREVHLMKLSTLFGIGSRIPPRVATPQDTPPPPPVTPAAQPSASPPVIATPITTATATPPKIPVPSIFLPPPENRQKLSHSDIYLRYIQGIKSNSEHLSVNADSESLRASNTATPPQPLRAEEWFAPEAIKSLGGGANPSGPVVANALWALRDKMIKDSLLLEEHLKKVN